MPNRSSTGLLLPAIIVVGLIAVFGVNKVVDVVEDIFSSDDALVIGEGDATIMVAADAKPKVEPCKVPQIIQDKRCGDLHVLFVDAARMPFIARNTKLAWESGRPAVLTMNRAKQQANRTAACPRSFPKPHGGSCDEYPMASTDQGGKGARTEEVPVRENACQGGTYGAQYPKDGDDFLVVIIRPNLIAPSPFTGTDIAKEQGTC
jgi:hypothetical protein